MKKNVNELLEKGGWQNVWDAVKLALREAENAAWEAEPRDFLSDVGKFRHRIDAAIAHLQKIKSAL